MTIQTIVERTSVIAQGWLVSGGCNYMLAQVAPGYVELSRPATVSLGAATFIREIEGIVEIRQLQVVGIDPRDRQRLLVMWG